VTDMASVDSDVVERWLSSNGWPADLIRIVVRGEAQRLQQAKQKPPGRVQYFEAPIRRQLAAIVGSRVVPTQTSEKAQ
jgi:hypothetical protein